MGQSAKPQAGSQFPEMAWPKVGSGEINPAAQAGWRMLSIYRGKHCPLCKKYYKTLNGMLDAFMSAGVTVMAVSADPKEKADADLAEHGWRFPVGYGLTVEQMRSLGVYISEPRSPQETDRPFAEPALFVINPAGQLQIIDISNAPFSRPDLESILMGIKLIQERSYPIRGTIS